VTFDLALSPSQEAVVEAFGRFFERECPPAVVRRAEPLGFDQELWQKLRSLGAPGLGVTEEAGGAGGLMSDMCVVAEQAGRVLAPVPLVDHVVASRLHANPDVVDGSVVASLALRPASEGMWRLVPAGAVAGVVVGLDGDDLVAVHSEPPGRGPRNHADAPLADRPTAGDRVVVGDRSMFVRAVGEWQLLQAGQLAGLAARSLEIVTAYVSQRQQFGRPVGEFQAVQHGLADCVASVEGSRLLAAKAAWAVDEGLSNRIDMDHGEVGDADSLALMAFLFAAEAAALVTKQAVQYHGSYGVAREYDIQLYYRRARGWPLVLGDPGAQLQRLSDKLWPGRS
jgi:alkylation response protein AidB-like acyl-CoA dehydrogenase